MKIFKHEPNFKFMKKRYIAFVLSGLIIVAGFYSFYSKGFNLGIDFTGGTMVEVSFRKNISVGEIRSLMKKIGLSKSEITRVGDLDNKFFIKTEQSLDTNGKSDFAEENKDISSHEEITNRIKEIFRSEEGKRSLAEGKLDINNSAKKRITDFLSSNGISHDISAESAEKIDQLKKKTSKGLIDNFEELEKLGLKKRVMSILKEKSFFGNFTFLSNDFVGSQVGRKLRQQATLATVWAMIGMLIYIGIRFRFIFGIAAVVTLLHDVLITMSFILFFNIEVSLTVIAAILTIVGYSLNDTIVIFDRVRDNLKLMRRDNAEAILDRSINQTLSRTIVTSGTTLLTVTALYFLGGEVIHAFSFTLLIGIVIGTYSSIFQSCAWLRIWEKHFLKKKK